MIVRKVSWSKIKNFVDSRNLSFEFLENSDEYELFAYDGFFALECLVKKDGGVEVTDFENNYKSDSNKNLAQKIRGDSDNTIIGNIDDRLKVTTASPGSLEYDDMNVSNGGVARETEIGSTYTTIYSYSGSGALISFVTNLEKSKDENWQVRVVADGVSSLEVFTADFKDVYKLTDDPTAQVLGVAPSEDSFRFSAPGDQTIRFNSNISIQVRKAAGGNKKFKGGIAGVVKS